ncbi:MAG: methyltransferase domain-containing protein [Lutisporaceae bacterium]
MITQRDFFNSMAEKWDSVCQHDMNKIKYILDLLNIKYGANILDVGTGTGVLIQLLAEQVGEQGEITAIDVSDRMLEVAQRKHMYDNVSFVCGDVLEVDLPNEYFDYVICYSVFPHFDDKEFAVKILGKYLKQSGKLVICHSQSREAINNIHKSASEAVAEDNLPQINVIRGYFENLGLETIIEIDNGEMFVVAACK